MTKFPSGWVEARIGDLVEIGPRTTCPDDTVVGFVPLQRLGVTFRSRHTFEPRRWSEVRKGYTHFADGDVLLARITPSFENGKAGVARNLPNGLGAGSTEYFVCRPREQLLEPGYLLAFFKTRTFLKEGERLMSGAVGQQRVPKQYVLNTEIPLAPPNEQRRIVDKLEALLERVDACRERLDRIPGIVKRFRQSVLAAATTGELTREWREDRGHAPDLSSWAPHALAELCDSSRVITYGVVKLGDETPGGVPCLRTSNVRWLKIETDGMKCIAPTLSAEFRRTVLRGGEVLVNVRGTLGGVAVAESGMRGWNVSREVAVVPVDTSRVHPQFLAFWIGSEASQRWLSKVEKGVAYTGINIEDLRTLPVSIPSIDEQEEIVRRVQALLDLADGLDRRHQVLSGPVGALTESLLAKAFRGEIVPPDPDDESARQLGERVAAGRVTSQKLPREQHLPAPRSPRVPRAPKDASVMTKSRQDEDVKGKAYLAGHLRKLGGPATAEALFKVADLPIADFYKQLAWEVELGHVKDNRDTLESVHAAG